MGMTIDECIEIWTYPTQYFPSKREEAMDFAIDTMRKYQKIQEIINNAKDSDGAVKYNWLYKQIREVVEDGNVN